MEKSKFLHSQCERWASVFLSSATGDCNEGKYRHFVKSVMIPGISNG